METKSKNYTKKEREEIDRLLKDGKSCTYIANQIGRSSAGVAREVAKNGGKYFYNSDKAQDRYEINTNKREASFKKSTEKALGIVAIHNKIASLEMQMEIVLNTLKELHDRSIKNK